MRQLSVEELDGVVGGLYSMDQTIDGDGGFGGHATYEYGMSTFYDANDFSGDWVGTVYEQDSVYLQNEAQALAIDWEGSIEGGSGGVTVRAKVSGKC